MAKKTVNEVDHFAWDGGKLEGLTPIGRITIRVLRINDPLRVSHREWLIELAAFPPQPSRE